MKISRPQVENQCLRAPTICISLNYTHFIWAGSNHSIKKMTSLASSRNESTKHKNTPKMYSSGFLKISVLPASFQN